MFCIQIHALATLPNYVLTHLMNKALRRQSAILEPWYVYFAMLCNSGPFITYHDTLAVWARYMARRFPAKTNRVSVWLSPEIWLRVLKWT